jgi:Zn-dependent peptidase ImmA (M78 family)/transcriptional regulator with XRE-family HTH domain
MPANDAPINPAMVILAREARGVAQGALADRVDISQGHLSKMEGGLWPIPDDLLIRIAQELRFPGAFFRAREAIFGPGISEFYHRKRESAGALLIRQNYARMNIFFVHLGRLLRGVSIGDPKIPRFDPSDGRTMPEVAQSVRAMWHLPAGPIANLVGTVEAAGGVVLRWNFGSPKIDGISRWPPGLPPVFFINDQIPMDRFRLTLAHELGHMILHESPSAEMELEANDFAREFLMPGREIRRQLESCNLQRLSVLKPYWKVSMQALLYAAEDLSVVTPRTAKSLWAQLSKYKQREPPELDVPMESPQMFQEIVRVYRERLHFSVAQLGELLSANPDDLIREYGITPDDSIGPRMRIVK